MQNELAASRQVDRVVSALEPLRSPQRRNDDVRRHLPPIALAAIAPRVPPPDGGIQFSRLALPLFAPTVPGEIRMSSLELPTIAPIVPGEIRRIALTMPAAAPVIPGLVATTPETREPIGEADFVSAPAPQPTEPADRRDSPQIAMPSSVLPSWAPDVPDAAVGRTCAYVPDKPGVARSSIATSSGTAADDADGGRNFGQRLADQAIAQTRDMVVYTARYVRIAYPMGDVAPLFGVCSDVIVRAYRALGIDLQEMIARTRSGTGDVNIDHRRTEVLRRFLAVHGERFVPSSYGEDYLPGDIVTYYRPQNRTSTSHIALVTNIIGPSGRPMIVHNRGWGPQLEDALFVDQMTGHYRFSGLKPAAIAALAPLKPSPLPEATARALNKEASAAMQTSGPGLKLCKINPLTAVPVRGQLALCRSRPDDVRVHQPKTLWRTADRVSGPAGRAE